MNFGYLLKNIRNKRKITLRELDKKIKIKHSTLSNFETGKLIPNIHHFIKISEGLEISFSELKQLTIEYSKIVKPQQWQELILYEFGKSKHIISILFPDTLNNNFFKIYDSLNDIDYKIGLYQLYIKLIANISLIIPDYANIHVDIKCFFEIIEMLHDNITDTAKFKYYTIENNDPKFKKYIEIKKLSAEALSKPNIAFISQEKFKKVIRIKIKYNGTNNFTPEGKLKYFPFKTFNELFKSLYYYDFIIELIDKLELDDFNFIPTSNYPCMVIDIGNKIIFPYIELLFDEKSLFKLIYKDSRKSAIIKQIEKLIDYVESIKFPYIKELYYNSIEDEINILIKIITNSIDFYNLENIDTKKMMLEINEVLKKQKENKS